MSPERYNDLLIGLQQLGIGISMNLSGYDSEFLELFAHKEALTASEITRLIKSTELEMAPKNVNRKVHKLKQLGLIIETKSDKIRRHNEKPHKLTDLGIYHLFKVRVEGIIYDQLSVRKGPSPVSGIGQFLKNYENDLVFELFLYPYFEKQTISKMSFSLLEKIFWHLQDCCRKVDTIMCDGYVLLPQFLWDNIPGQDEAALLTSLSNIFSLHEWDKETVHINKTSNGRIIVVRTPKIRIEIELDVSKLKAISTIKRDIDHRTDIAKYEYEVLESSFEIAVCVPQPLSESLRDSWECKRFLESIDSSFYDLVVSIKSDDIENYAVLAKDIKFMKHFDKVESEYQRMIQITKNLR